MLNLILKEQLSASGYAVNAELKTFLNLDHRVLSNDVNLKFPFNKKAIQ